MRTLKENYWIGLVKDRGVEIDFNDYWDCKKEDIVEDYQNYDEFIYVYKTIDGLFVEIGRAVMEEAWGHDYWYWDSTYYKIN